MLNHRDICGTPIEVGAYATYFVCSGYSHIQVRICRVVKLNEYTVQAVAAEPKPAKDFGTLNVRIHCNVLNNGNLVTIQNTERMTVVPLSHIDSGLRYILDALFEKELAKNAD